MAVRAGLLSDIRVVALLHDLFVPCLTTARNTCDLLVDPRDDALLARYAQSSGEQFVGGEREAFVLPDGTMLDVFLSLAGPSHPDGKAHGTAAGRRSDRATALFERHAAAALRRAHGSLPAAWASYWNGTAPTVRQLAARSAAWPAPAPGTQALRVFVRNGHLAYDDLHGCGLVPLTDSARLPAAPDVGSTVALPMPLFRDLVRAMVPRGGVDTRLADESIAGELVFAGARRDGDVVHGIVRGHFAMRPMARSEWGRRANGAMRFETSAELLGRFEFDRTTGRWRSLRIATRCEDHHAFWPWTDARSETTKTAYAAAIEWVATLARTGDG